MVYYRSMNETEPKTPFQEKTDTEPETPITIEDLESKRQELEHFAMKQDVSAVDAQDIVQDVIISLSKDPLKLSRSDHNSYLHA